MKINSIQRQSVIHVVSTISLTIIGFISTIYFAHSLGPALLGAYFLFLAYIGIFNLIGDGGFGGAAVKRISEGKEQNEYLSAFIFIRIILLTVTVTVIIFLEPYFRDINSSGLFFWLILALILSMLSGSIGLGVYGTGKVGIYQVSNFIDVLFRTTFQIVAVFLGFGIAGLAGGFIGGLIAGSIVNFQYVDLKLVPFGISHLKKLSGFSFWIFLTTAGSLVFCYADTILIGYFMSNADVGIYRTAFQLTSVGAFTTMAFQNVLYPKISRWEMQGQVLEIENSLARAFTYSLLLAVPTCIGGWILGGGLLLYLYGTSFVGGAPALVFLLLVQVVNIFMTLGTMSLNALNQPKKAFNITLIAAIMNIILDIVLIPVMGIVGAAIATLIAMLLNAIGAIIFLRQFISVKFEYLRIKNIMSAAILMGIFLLSINFFLPINQIAILIIEIATGALLYSYILLRIDRKIRNEIRDLIVNLGIPWPGWL